MPTNSLPPFPDWLLNGAVIGRNADGESLAVGCADNGTAWLARLNHHTNVWCNVRHATDAEVDTYDILFLERCMAAGRDTRTTPPAEWRLN